MLIYSRFISAEATKEIRNSLSIINNFTSTSICIKRHDIILKILSINNYYLDLSKAYAFYHIIVKLTLSVFTSI